MKTSLNKHKRSAAGLLIAVAAFAAALTGCQKDFEMDLPSYCCRWRWRHGNCR